MLHSIQTVSPSRGCRRGTLRASTPPTRATTAACLRWSPWTSCWSGAGPASAPWSRAPCQTLPSGLHRSEGKGHPHLAQGSVFFLKWTYILFSNTSVVAGTTNKRWQRSRSSYHLTFLVNQRLTAHCLWYYFHRLGFSRGNLETGSLLLQHCECAANVIMFSSL